MRTSVLADEETRPIDGYSRESRLSFSREKRMTMKRVDADWLLMTPLDLNAGWRTFAPLDRSIFRSFDLSIFAAAYYVPPQKKVTMMR